MRQANVYFNGRLAGRLTEGDDGHFEYRYDPLYQADGAPIAFSIPLSLAPYHWDSLPAFFENLVSEGWLRRVQAQTQRVDENDSFGLLLENGRDLVGAVSVIRIEDDK